MPLIQSRPPTTRGPEQYALNINFFLLPTKFLQPVNLAILTIWSLFNPLTVPTLHRLSPFLAHQPSRHWKSQIAHSDMHPPVSGINSLILSVSLASLSTHLLIHLSAHLYYHHHSHHPSLADLRHLCCHWQHSLLHITVQSCACLYSFCGNCCEL